MVRSVAREEKTKKAIIDLLGKNDFGLTISDISRILKLHYTTVSKYLAVLEAGKLAVHRDIGMAKVFRLAQLEKKESKNDEN